MNSAGAVTSSSITDAFGYVACTQTTAPDPFGFGAQAGYYTDNETGAVLCGLRYYNPATGQFINRDPIAYGGGANVYAFCGNNPVNRRDPFGTDSRDLGQSLTALGTTMLGTSLIMEMTGGAADATVVASPVGVATNVAGLFVAASGTAVALTGVTISAANSFGDWMSHCDGAGGESGEPGPGEEPIRPRYRANPKHDPVRTHSGADPEPPDAEKVSELAQFGGKSNSRKWFAKGSEGWYQYTDSNDGMFHFAGILKNWRIKVPNNILKNWPK